MKRSHIRNTLLAFVVAAASNANAQSIVAFDSPVSQENVLVITVPEGNQALVEGLKQEIETYRDKSCAGAEGLGCIEITPIEEIITLINTPKNCQLAPCLPGCPGAGELMCLPPLMRSTGFTRTQAPHERVTDVSTFEAQGGGSVSVVTFGDGSHEAYYSSINTGVSLIEAGGGGGGHQAVLDDIMAQWAAK